MATTDITLHDRRRLRVQLFVRIWTAVSAVAFWIGILAPIAYLFVLVPGLRTEGRFGVLLALLGVHYLALVLGHSHNTTER